MKRLLTLCSFVIIATGCSSNYTCSEYPEAGCQPVSTVYERTNGGYNDYRETLFDKNIDEERNPKNESTRSVQVGEAYRTLNYAVPGDPILTKPEVMRVFINSFVDEDGDWHSGGYVYIKLREAEWVSQGK